MFTSNENPFLVKEIEKEWLKYYDEKKFQGRNSGNRQILKSECKGFVLNKIQKEEIKDNYVEILNLKYENLEKIFNFQINNDLIFFTTHLFFDKLATVWKKKSQFTKYNVREMFYDFWKALSFLKLQNISHGTIHENNLAFDGKKWYVSGLLSPKKMGDCMSVNSNQTYKSRRLLKNTNDDDNFFDIIPSDDMWQLVLMYVITYYGFNPFNENVNIFTVVINIIEGKCKEISNSKYGKYLKEILISENELKDYDYTKILNIIENNTDDHF
jgi:hypothetical protein